MRDYQKIMGDYDSKNIIKHEWGQNYTSLFNSVARLWNKNKVGEKIAISSYKKFGIKSTIKFLEKNGINTKVVGKGPDNLRVVEVIKDSDRILEPVTVQNNISFVFNDREYTPVVGSAIFSKTDLDTGTRFLLDTLLDKKIDLNNCKVADFGSGWGAIALVLANEFPAIQLTAYEKDDSSVDAMQINLKRYRNVHISKTDLTQTNSGDIENEKGTFDYIISNPPFHATKDQRVSIFESADKLLRPGGVMLFVTEGHFVEKFRKTAQDHFSILDETNKDRWVVFQCQK